MCREKAGGQDEMRMLRAMYAEGEERLRQAGIEEAGLDAWYLLEFVTGVDLVKAQIKIAAGEPLDYTQDDIQVKGHSIECRINAENPKLNFRPSPGKILALHTPGGPGIRIDSAAYQGYTISPYYDSMIAKLIVYAPTRQEAIMKMKWALSEFIVEGIDTNIDFQLALVKCDEFQSGDYNNRFLDTFKFE